MKRVVWGIIAVVASAFMLVLSLPPADVHPLAFVALVPVLLAVRGQGFAVGFASGMGALLLGAFIARMGWFYEPSLLESDPGWIFAGFVILGIAVGLTCAVVGEMKSFDKWSPWLIAAWAVAFEAFLLIYFPLHLGLTQYRQLPAMKIASIAGIWGVSYFVWVVNLIFAFSFQEKKKWTLGACGLVLGLYIGLGAITGHPKPGEFKIAIVQTQSMDLTELAEMNRQATKDGAQMVVWPELSGMSIAMGNDTTELVELASQSDQAPFVTSFEDDNTPLPFNVAAVFSKSGESDRYEKRKPFGAESTIHEAGTEPTSATINGVTYGLNICFDSCFPAVMRDTAKLDGVEVILLPTLDPITPFGFAQAAHAAFTPFRAAELGVPIVRADITGYSMVVDARGVITSELGAGTEEARVVGIKLESRNTLYKRLGDWFLYLCLLGCIAGFVVSKKKSARAKAAD